MTTSNPPTEEMEETPTVPIQLRAAREAFSSWDGFLAFGFGAGLLPRAPGTMGTLVAVPLVFLLRLLEGPTYWFVLTLLFLLGVWICGRVGRRLGVDDYGGIVWDEMVGFWLVLSFFPLNWITVLAGFVLFRLFDILKPWPISHIEAQFSGGLGVMIDDLLAAVYAMVLLGGLEYLLRI